MIQDSEGETFDDFKKMMESSFPTSASDVIADKYDDVVPKSVQLLANLDPTGIVSTINQYLTENKAKREQENVLYAIYWCRKSILKHQDMLRNLEKEYLEQQGPELMNLYFEHCKNTYNLEKIEFFRNVWINGMIKDDRDLDEKAYVFDLAASLTLDQIIILRHIYEKFNSETNDVAVNDIVEALKIEKTRVQHLCISLQGLGLLQYTTNDVGGWMREDTDLNVIGGNYFRMTEYVKEFVMYIMEPDLAPSTQDHKKINLLSPTHPDPHQQARE